MNDNELKTQIASTNLGEITLAEYEAILARILERFKTVKVRGYQGNLEFIHNFYTLGGMPDLLKWAALELDSPSF